MLWSTNSDGLCNYLNRRWLEFRGRTIDEEMGSGWLEGVHPDDRQRYADIFWRSFETRQPFDIEYRLQRADGQYRWVRDSGRAQFDGNGEFTGYTGACIEIAAPGRGTSVSPLTAREVQVLALVADGKSTKEVASLLQISYKTADSHRSRIMEKLGVHETASLVRYAVRQGIVPA